MTARRLLFIVGSLSIAVYAVIVWLSWRFEYVDTFLSNAEQYALLRQRPIVPVLVCFALLFGLYLVGLAAALKHGSNRGLMPTLFGFAIGFRLLLLVSEPIQEVDIYRYLWDGEVVCAGVSPFRFSPQQVLDAGDNETLPADFRRLVELRDSSPAISEIVKRVHFGQLPTVYPPVSQAVFATAAWTTPHSASVRARVVIMRCWLLWFDMATAWLLLLILRHLGRPDGWVMAYAWCPLVLKEFANSGHLDSIAICLTTAAILVAVKAFFPRASQSPGLVPNDQTGTASASRMQGATLWRQTYPNNLWMATLAAALLALAVGAKLYPVVLVPLLAATSVRRIGWSATLLPGFTFILLASLVCMPMVSRPTGDGANASLHRDPAGMHAPPLLNDVAVTPQDPGHGLSTFLRRWEMNDFLFLLIVENLDPATNVSKSRQAWFVVTPHSWRESLVNYVSHHFQLAEKSTPFLITRTLTSGCFLLLALWWSWRSSTIGTAERFLECAFLTLAWFWLLLPTQNPWYWIWALPFVPFARSRVWLAMSGCVMIYYLRFWLGYHWPDGPVLATRYAGNQFFDFVASWIEFGPWFICLAIEYVRNKAKSQSA